MGVWDEAKRQAQINGRPNDWAYIMSLCREKGELNKSILLYIDGNKLELLGESSTGNPLVKSKSEVLELSEDEYNKSKKMFKSKKSGNLIPIKKVVTRRDGTTFMQTFYVTAEEAAEMKSGSPAKEEDEPTGRPVEDVDWRNKTAELQADIAAMWQLQCRNLYKSSNLGALSVREGVQNSRDAINQAVKNGSIDRGKIDITWEGDNLTIEDNGIGMDVKTLHTKFLNLGGTTKGGGAGDGSSIGGFGVAKAVILGAGEEFEIHTRDNFLDSRELGKGTIEETKERQGTRITVKNVEVGKNWSKDNEPIKLSERTIQFDRGVRDYLETSEYDNMDIFIQGEKVEPRFNRTAESFRSLADFNVNSENLPDGTNVELNVFPKGEDDYSSGHMYVRLGGLTQFVQYIGDSKVDVVVDFEVGVDPRSHKYPFSSSRESLKTKYEPILDAIRDTLTKNPQAVSSQTKYKETIFENKDKKVEEERKMSLQAMMKETTELLERIKEFTRKGKPRREPDESDTDTYDEYDDGESLTEVQGKRDEPSLIDRIQHKQNSYNRKANELGITVEELIEKTTVVNEVDANEENPLEYSWLVWEDKNRDGDFDLSKNLPVLVAWDAILNKIAGRFGGNVPVFYPGFVLESGTLGMSVKKPTDAGMREYIMINPEEVKTDNDWVVAGYLKAIACHELSHAINGSYEQHGENHSYTREALDIRSLDVMDDLVKLVKETKLRSHLNKIKKGVKKREEKERYNEYFEEVQKIDDEFESIENAEAVKEMLYWGIYRDENQYNSYPESGKIETGDRVYCLDRNYPDVLGERLRVADVDHKNQEVVLLTEGGVKPEIRVKMSKVSTRDLIDTVGETLSGMNVFGYKTGYRDFRDRHYDTGLATVVSKYLPAYKMKKMGQMDSRARFKSLKNHLTASAVERYSEEFSRAKTDSQKSYYKREIKEHVNSEFSGIMREFDSNYYYSSEFTNDKYDVLWDESESLAESVVKVMSKKGKKPSKKKTEKQVTPEEAQLSSDLKNMSNSDIFRMADDMGVTGLEKYDNEAIRRMRAIMAIKRKKLEGDK